MNYSITSCFDWFQVVFDHIPYYEEFSFEHGKPKSFNQLNTLLKILKINETFLTLMSDITYGMHGYKYRIPIVEGISILLFGPKNSSENYTTLLQVTGKGCAYLTTHDIWFDLFNYFNLCNAKFTRLDLATDIKGDYPLSIYKIYNCIKKGNYKSIFKKGYIITGTPPENEYEGKINPLTIYTGSKGNSSSFVRIYNKAVEQGLDPIAEPWLRIEIQIQDTSKIICIINAFMIAYEKNQLNLFNSVCLGTLQDFLTLTDNNGDILDLWEDLLNDIERIELFSNPKSKNSFDSSEEWFKRCCSRFLAMAILVYGETYVSKMVINNAYEYMREFDRQSLNVVNSKMYSLGFEKDKFKLIQVQKLGLDMYEVRNEK